MKRDPLVEIEVGILADTAASLAQAGRTLQRAVRELHALQPRGGDEEERARRLRAAARALWACVVQREAVGLTDHRAITEAYGVTPEIWRRLGAG